ncbi:Xaa-Pro dipeptidase [Bradyrhizobium macuxiense]|uniref:Xaa-Pro dipeptidase n=2 Tax=Bradyrhizobium macuxiense TaxID=1755647 RepID=A0A560KYR6_9BRAD|nr:Xaa-Pro dipeptidase [Bradyrhizobium macuxiense]
MTDIRIWYDTVDANPAEDLKRILEEKGLRGARIGVELATYGLTGANWERLRNALDGWCVWSDASSIVQELRSVKSDEELVYVRKAAALADDAVITLFDTGRAGVSEASVIAAIDASASSAGGDICDSPRIFGSGPKAILFRPTTGSRVMKDGEQVTIEWAGVSRRYHAAIFRTAAIGRANSAHRSLFPIVRDALEAMTEAAAPGQPVGKIDEAYRRVFDAAGYAENRVATSGYSMGATFPPKGIMDYPPLLFAGNSAIAKPGMVFFLHAVYANEQTGAAMTLGHSILITQTGREVLSRLPLEYRELL